MKSILIIFLTLLLSYSLSAQNNLPQPPLGAEYIHGSKYKLININKDILVAFHPLEDTIIYSRSSDAGLTWTPFTPMAPFNFNYSNEYYPLVKNDTFFIFINIFGSSYLIISGDLGLTWSTPHPLSSIKGFSAISIMNNYFVILTYNDTCWISSNGFDWQPRYLPELPKYKAILKPFKDGLLLFCRIGSGMNIDFISFDFSISNYGSFKVFFDDDFEPFIIGDTIYVGFSRYNDFYTRFSTNLGRTWTDPLRWSRYRSNRYFNDVYIHQNKPYLVLVSDKYDNREFKVSMELLSVPEIAPPALYSLSFTPDHPAAGDSITFKINASDFTDDFTAVINYKDKNTNRSFIMNKDSMRLFTVTIPPIPLHQEIEPILTLSNSFTSVSHQFRNIIILPLPLTNVFTTNELRLKLTFDQTGRLTSQAEPQFDGYPRVLWNNGFALGGITDNKPFVATQYRSTYNFISGPVGADPTSPYNAIYVIKNDDPPFDAAWQNWKYAVSLGAPFYDGDNDGTYNPIDKNNNGIWDSFEDSPGNIGKYYAWMIFNDAVPQYNRRFYESQPKGIEVQKTIFYDYSDSFNENIIYFRYKITNKGKINLIDSAYFSVLSDFDLYEKVGTDTLLNSTFTYSTENVGYFAPNYPAFFNSILQGPHTYIPGITYNDLNADGKFTPGVDTPIDTAIYKYGSLINNKVIPGAQNLLLTSSNIIYFTHGPHNEPNTTNELYSMIKGFSKYNEVLNPCSFSYGTVLNEDCSLINPFFLFSGDPVANTGWLTGSYSNYWMMSNVGPFQLPKDEPVEIITAYVVGRGTDNLNSITVARDNVRYAIDNYNNNFYKSAINSPNSVLIDNYKLSQNFPNPFNPVTKIRYSVPSLSNLSLKIYDILGREVAVLINNQPHPLGEYEIDFNAAELSSGVYLYHLTSGSSSVSKKMLLLK